MAKNSNDLVKIQREVCEKYGLSISKFIVLLFYHIEKSLSLESITVDLCSMGLLTPSYKHGVTTHYSPMDKGLDLIDTVILESDEDVLDDLKLSRLVSDLKAIFPDGKKEGTAQYWRGGTAEIKNRLLSFFKKYGDYPPEDILNAAKKYVDSFREEGSYRNMRLLKYFIWKKENKHGEIEESSDLLSFLENSGEDESINYGDWTTVLK